MINVIYFQLPDIKYKFNLVPCRSSTKKLMDLRDICFISIIVVILSSASYLIFLIIDNALPPLLKIRFANFIIQHFFCAAMLMTRQVFLNQIQTFRNLLWMIGFTTINFLDFVAFEVVCLIRQKNEKYSPGIDSSNYDISFIVLSYFHLYYQYNIYIGVFCLFSIAMGVLYTINQRRHQQEMDQLLDQIRSERYSASFRQQSCSICLAQFEKQQHIYKLACGHIYHKQCLKDWFKQKLTCPMCRDDATRILYNRDQPNNQPVQA